MVNVKIFVYTVLPPFLVIADHLHSILEEESRLSGAILQYVSLSCYIFFSQDSEVKNKAHLLFPCSKSICCVCYSGMYIGVSAHQKLDLLSDLVKLLGYESLAVFGDCFDEVTLLDPVQYPGAIKIFAREVCRNDLLNFGRLHFFFPDSRLALDLSTDKTLKEVSLSTPCNAYWGAAHRECYVMC